MGRLNTNLIRQLLDVIDTDPRLEESIIRIIQWKIMKRQNEIFPPVRELSSQEVDAGIRLGKLHAVKMHKARTQCGLMDSKYIVEQYFKDHGLQFKHY